MLKANAKKPSIVPVHGAFADGTSCPMNQNLQRTGSEPAHQAIPSPTETGCENIHRLRRVRTVIADHSPSTLKTLAQILEHEGCFSLLGSATDGRRAVRLALTMEPELVLIGYRMPDLNGVEATRYIKHFENPPLIIVVTSDDAPHSRALAKAAGADGVVDQGGDLHDQLRSVFRGRFRFAPETFLRCGQSESD